MTEHLKKSMLYGLRGALIAGVAVTVILVFLMVFKDKAYYFSDIWQLVSASWEKYVISISAAMVAMFILVVLAMAKWTKIESQFTESMWLSLILTVLCIVEGFMMGLIFNYDWDASMNVVYGLIVVSFVFGTLGRGWAIIHCIAVAGFTVVLSADVTNMLPACFNLLAAFAGYGVNRLVYIVFVREHAFEA